MHGVVRDADAGAGRDVLCGRGHGCATGRNQARELPGDCVREAQRLLDDRGLHRSSQLAVSA